MYMLYITRWSWQVFVSKGWLLLWRKRLTFLDGFPKLLLQQWLFRNFSIFLSTVLLGSLGFSDKQHPALASHVKGQGWPEQAPLYEFLGTPLSLNWVPKSKHFPNTSYLCQSDIHSGYCIFHAPVPSIPYFLMLRGKWYSTFINVLLIFLQKANILCFIPSVKWLTFLWYWLFR